MKRNKPVRKGRARTRKAARRARRFSPHRKSGLQGRVWQGPNHALYHANMVKDN